MQHAGDTEDDAMENLVMLLTHNTNPHMLSVMESIHQVVDTHKTRDPTIMKNLA